MSGQDESRGISAVPMREIIAISNDDYAQHFVANDGRQYHRIGPEWEPFTGSIFQVNGTPEELAKLRELMAR